MMSRPGTLRMADLLTRDPPAFGAAKRLVDITVGQGRDDFVEPSGRCTMTIVPSRGKDSFKRST